jgi:hypothetical protein
MYLLTCQPLSRYTRYMDNKDIDVSKMTGAEMKQAQRVVENQQRVNRHLDATRSQVGNQGDAPLIQNESGSQSVVNAPEATSQEQSDFSSHRFGGLTRLFGKFIR